MSTAIDPLQIGGNCRFYVKEFPELEECVMVQVQQIAEMGAYVKVGAGTRAPPPQPHAPPQELPLRDCARSRITPTRPRSCSSTTT